MKRALLAALCIVALSSCAGDASDERSAEGSRSSAIPSASASASPTPEPTPTPPPKPRKAHQAALSGTYVVKYHIVYSTFVDPAHRSDSKWKATPKCRTAPCRTLLESSNDWRSKAQFVKDHYEWARVIKDAYYCEIERCVTKVRGRWEGPEVCRSMPSTRTWVDGTVEYSIKPIAMRLLDNVWVVSRFSGQLTFTGNELGVCATLAEERAVVSGVLKS